MIPKNTTRIYCIKGATRGIHLYISFLKYRYHIYEETHILLSADFGTDTH